MSSNIDLQFEIETKVKCLEIASKLSTSEAQLLKISKEIYEWVYPKPTQPILGQI
jgi:hypothetical protein